MLIQGVYKVPYHPYISETVQNFEKSQNTYSIVSRTYSFKGVGDVAPQKDAPEGAHLNNFKWNLPYYSISFERA